MAAYIVEPESIVDVVDAACEALDMTACTALDSLDALDGADDMTPEAEEAGKPDSTILIVRMATFPSIGMPWLIPSLPAT